MQVKPKSAAGGRYASRAEQISWIVCRVLILCVALLIFFPQVSPSRISMKINQNTSLLTSAVSYSTITNSLGRALRSGWVKEEHFRLLMAGSMLVLAGILLSVAGACMSLGNNRMRRLGVFFPVAGALCMGGGLLCIYRAYTHLVETATEAGKLDKIEPVLPDGLFIFAAFAGGILLFSLLTLIFTRKAQPEIKMEMDEKFRLFLMFLPVLLLAFVFCYLPIYGWRFAFYDYTIGQELTADKFVGFYWFKYLFTSAMKTDLVRVLRNTLIMSGLGIATSWLPIAFAIFLAEVRSSKFQRFVQTFTTIPNFISWVLVYAFAFAIFSNDGFLNSFLKIFGVNSNTDYLASADAIWIKMLLWGQWKGVGWSAIIYIAGISGIDQQLYEAARVDGAGRFQCIRHITVPGLMPTYCVMLLMSVAGILSNGMEQYLVFENALNTDVIEVLDLYVYHLGFGGSNQIPISTVIGISKSLVGVTLLFAANRISKTIRGESII